MKITTDARPAAVPESDRYGVEEACEYLKVSRSTLYRWRKDGILTGTRLRRGDWVFTRQQLDAARDPAEVQMQTAMGM